MATVTMTVRLCFEKKDYPRKEIPVCVEKLLIYLSYVIRLYLIESLFKYIAKKILSSKRFKSSYFIL